MELGYALTNDYVICYRLQQDPGGIKLKLWEPATSPGHQPPESPYLYAVNFCFPRLSAAEAFLRDYLLSNGAIDVPETNFPDEGEVAILPFPTWGMDNH